MVGQPTKARLSGQFMHPLTSLLDQSLHFHYSIYIINTMSDDDGGSDDDWWLFDSADEDEEDEDDDDDFIVFAAAAEEESSRNPPASFHVRDRLEWEEHVAQLMLEGESSWKEERIRMDVIDHGRWLYD